jgi:excisionase family DNA binding protein
MVEASARPQATPRVYRRLSSLASNRYNGEGKRVAKFRHMGDYAKPERERLKEALDNLRQALEELESSLLEFEETLSGEETVRPQDTKGLELLSIAEVCQELGMGKSWVYRRLKNGEIPSIKLGRTIKVQRSDLEVYLESMRYSVPRRQT